MITVELEGGPQFQSALERIARDIRDPKLFLSKVLRPAARPLVEAIAGATPKLSGYPSFDVYRTPKKSNKMKAPKGMGKIYVKIKPNQLKDSIGVFTTAVSRRAPAVYVGPRYKFGKWKKPDLGGWYWAMVQYGTPTVDADPFVMKGLLMARGNIIKYAEGLMKKTVKEVVTRSGARGVKLV